MRAKQIFMSALAKLLMEAPQKYNFRRALEATIMVERV